MSLPLKDFTVIIENNVPIAVHQQVNDKTYHIKEYTMPETFHETTDYKISVCSETSDFFPQIETVSL